MKKFISSIIALAMVLSMLPMTMLTAHASDQEVLVSLGKSVTLSHSDQNASSRKSYFTDGVISSQNTLCYTWCQINATYYAEIDLEEVHSITSASVTRLSSQGGNKALKVWASETKLDAYPTEATAKLLGTTEAGGSGTYTQTVTPAQATEGRYIYLTGTSGTEGIVEVMVFAKPDTEAVNVLADKTGTTSWGGEMTNWTDGDADELTAGYGGVSWGIPANSYVLYDLGTPMDLKYFYCSPTRDSDYYLQQSLYVKASNTNDISTATTLIAPFAPTENRDAGPLNGYLKEISGKYQYIWVGASPAYNLCIDDVRLYGYDTREPVTATFTNLADGTQNVTNIANLQEHTLGNNQHDNLTTITEPIWVQFSDNVDMQTVSASTVKVNKGTSAVSYTPVIDTENKRLGVDIADLAPNTTYTIEVTEGVKSTENLTATPATLTFETHVPAKIRYKEGREIINVAYGATTKIVGDNSKSPTPSITDVKIWTNGVMGAESIDDYALATAGEPAPYAIIDLGDTYQIMGQATVSGSSNWQSRYFQMNVLQSEDEALSDSNLLEKVGNTSSTGYCQSTLENAKGRYIAITSLGESAQDDGKGHLKLQEVLILTQTVPNPVSQDKTTRIEIEDYADEFAAAFGEETYEDNLGNYANPTQPVGMVKYTGPGTPYSGVNNNAMYGSKTTDGAKTFSIPVTVTEEGYYNATYRIGGTTGTSSFAWLDAALVAEDGTEYSLSNGMLRGDMGKDDSPNTEARATQNMVNDGGSRHIWKITSSAVKVPAGEYDLKFTINGSTLTFDYVDINPFAAAEVGTPIETDSMALTTVSYEGVASNDTIQYTSWANYDKAQTSYTYPVKIAEAGKYEIETVMSYKVADTLSSVTVLVDGKEVYKNNVKAEDVSRPNEEGVPQFINKNFPMNKYTGVVELDAGEHEITYVITKTSDNAYKFAIDYTMVAPYIENPISQSEVTRIEAETYADAFAKAFGQETYDEPAASYFLPTDSAVAKYIPTTTCVSGNVAMVGRAIEADAIMEIPVTVTEAGTYQAKFRIGGYSLIEKDADGNPVYKDGKISTPISGVNSGSVASAKVILVDKAGNEYDFGGGVITNITEPFPDGPAKTLTEPEIYAHSASIFSAYTGVQYVPAGEYTAKIVIPAGKYTYTTKKTQTNEETGETETVNVVNNVNKAMVLDYIEFSAAAPVAAVGENIEVENYIKVSTYEKDAASDDKLVYTGWAHYTDETNTLSIPVQVDEAGYYDIETVMTHAPKPDTSNMVVSVGGTEVYNNANPGTDMSDSDGDGKVDFIDGWFPLHKYSGNKVYLEAGMHNIEYTLNRTFDNAYKFAIDYVKLTKSTDTIEIDDGLVIINATYDQSVAADAYVAFYNDGKFVSVEKKGAVEDGQYIGIIEEPTEAYDKVKVFAWDKTGLPIPQAVAIGFMIQK